MMSFMKNYLSSKGQASGQIGRQAALYDLFLGFFKIIWDAIERKATLSIIDHKGCSRIAIAGLAYASGVDDGTVAQWCLPIPLRRNNHLICEGRYRLVEAKQGKQCLNLLTLLIAQVGMFQKIDRIDFYHFRVVCRVLYNFMLSYLCCCVVLGCG